MTDGTSPLYWILLRDEFLRRKNDNPRYSLRAFAKALGVNHTTLSLVMSRKREISKLSLLRIAQNLKLSEERTASLLKNRIQDDRELSDGSYHQLREDVFQAMSNWYFSSIMTLALMKDNVATGEWISSKINIDVKTAQQALDTLVRLQQIEIVGGRMRCCHSKTKTTIDVPSTALRTYHKQVIGLAQRSIENVPVELRDISASSIPFNIQDIRGAKDFIKKFRRKFCRKFEDVNADQVYSISIQFMPFAEPKESKK